MNEGELRGPYEVIQDVTLYLSTKESRNATILLSTVDHVANIEAIRTRPGLENRNILRRLEGFTEESHMTLSVNS